MTSRSDSTTKKSPYERVMSDLDGQHPIEMMLEKRCPQRELKDRIRAQTAELREALGDQSPLWIELEPLLNQRNAEREEAHFNLGYEFGLATGRAGALTQLSKHASEETREFAERLRTTIKRSDLPTQAIFATLLETAWAFIDQLATDSNDDE